MMKLADSVAMIGGMRKRPDQEVIGEADRKPAGDRGGEADEDQPVVAAHRLHRDGAGEPDIGRQRQVDIAGPERDDEHLPDADNDGEDRERQRRRQHALRAIAAGEGDRTRARPRRRRRTTRSTAA